MKAVAIAILLVAALAVEDIQMRFLFENFRAQHGKFYNNAHEALMRFDIFSHNVAKINEHNKVNNYKVGINQFADMTFEEYEAFVGLGGFQPSEQTEIAELPLVDAPNDIDWTTKGAVTPMKNQGQCGSCWAFSSVCALEALNKIKTGSLVALSEQQLVDCVNTCSGCKGGRMDTAYSYLAKNGGVCAESAYPYKAVQGTCKACTKVVKVNGHANLPSENCPALLNAAAQQVVAIAVAASSTGWQFYTGGIIDANCDERLNHAVSLVGYGVEGGKNFWKVRNSWGAGWGERGYVRILRTDTTGKPTMCGVAKDCVIPK